MSPTPQVRRVLTWLAVAIAVAVVASTLWTVACYRRPMPFLDQWAIVDDVEALAGGAALPARLLRMHNEHWIVVPRLLLWLDTWLTGAGGALAVATTLLLQAAHAGLLLRLGARLAPRRVPMALVAAAFAAAFSAAQLENFMEPFQVQFALVYLAASASFAALVRAREAGRGRRWLWTAIGCALVAGLSMGNGILAWPVLLALAWWLRMPRRALAAIAAVAAANIAALALSYQAPSHLPSPTGSLAQPLDLAQYLLCSLGSFVSAQQGPAGDATRTVAGTLLLFGFGLGLAGVARSGRNDTPAARGALAAVILFAVASLALIALGRSRLGLVTAMAPRYATPTLLATVALLLLAWSDLRRRSGAAAAIVAALVVLAIVPQQPSRLGRGVAVVERRLGSIVACRAGVRDAQWLLASAGNLDSSQIDRLVPFLRERGWAMFANGAHRHLGRPLTEALGPGAMRECAGSIALAAVPGTGWGVRLTGRIEVPPDESPPGDGFVIDDQDRIVGCCAVQRTLFAATAPLDFVGSATTQGNGQRLRVVFADGRGGCLALAAAGTVTGTEVASAAGARIPDIDGGVEGSFAMVTADSEAPEPPTFVRRAVASTGPGTGVATILLADAHDFALPIATGTATFAVGVGIFDAATGRRVLELHPAPTLGAWRIWRIALPDQFVGRKLAVKIGDLGRFADQWIAVGEPLQLAP